LRRRPVSVQRPKPGNGHPALCYAQKPNPAPELVGFELSEFAAPPGTAQEPLTGQVPNLHSLTALKRDELTEQQDLFGNAVPVQCDGLPVDSGPCKQPGCHRKAHATGKHDYHPRPTVAAETSDRLIDASKPGEATSKARGPVPWLREIEELLKSSGKRSDGIRTILWVAKRLINGVWDWAIAVTKPGWAALERYSKRARRTIARALEWLRSQGLLSVVATGQSADCSKDGMAKAAVYALWTTKEMPALGPEIEDREKLDGTPTPLLVNININLTLHAREHQTDSLREAHSRVAIAPSAPHGAALPADRPLSKRKKAKEERLERARALMKRLPVLAKPYKYHGHRKGIIRNGEYRCSVKSIAAVIRVFDEAGYTTKDLVDAAERLPNQEYQPAFSFDGGVTRPDQWLKKRLAAWLDEAGQPIESNSQRRNRLDAERAAEQAAARRLKDEERARRAAEEATWPSCVKPRLAAYLKANQVPLKAWPQNEVEATQAFIFFFVSNHTTKRNTRTPKHRNTMVR